MEGGEIGDFLDQLTHMCVKYEQLLRDLTALGSPEGEARVLRQGFKPVFPGVSN